jgi:DNA-binding transcriptional regulator GbsR (MarR family)
VGKTKSFLKNISIDTAKRSHFCQHNKKHKINKGDKRLKFKEGRAFQHFCIECAKESLKKDINELNALLTELEKAGQQE